MEFGAEGVALVERLCVDAEGFLWVALWGGGQVRRYSPEGKLDRTLTFPASQVSSVAFGGDDLRDLYITSAVSELDALRLAQEALAGGLFRCQPGVQGLPAFEFAG